MTGHVTVLAGEPEYDSQDSMRAVAARFADHLNVNVDYRTPSILADEPDFRESSFGDLSRLEETDLLVVYTRFRRLPEEEMTALAGYLKTGRGVLGLRTSSHAFHFAEDSPWFEWNDGFGRDVLGSPWSSHHGHGSSTDVSVLPDAPPELVAGVPSTFHVRSWLYRTQLQAWCRPILWGDPVDPESPPTPGPVAWYGKPEGRRTFYTSLGHAEDLITEPVQRLLTNAAGWILAAGERT
ncbi:MAG: ThuA domain-containing protein [Propionibacteriaceae bacterium]